MYESQDMTLRASPVLTCHLIRDHTPGFFTLLLFFLKCLFVLDVERLSVSNSTLCEAIKSFEGILSCDLSFTVGDKITILTRTEKQYDWWEGKLRGKIGIFPANFVRVLTVNETF